MDLFPKEKLPPDFDFATMTLSKLSKKYGENLLADVSVNRITKKLKKGGAEAR